MAVFSCTHAQLSRQYARGPITVGEGAQFYYSLENDTKTISFGLVTTSDQFKSDSGPAWIGIGVSEATSGSMLGADIATAEFASAQNSECTLVDRHVPFAAYPLGEQSENASRVFPNEDKCQADRSWNLVACKRDTNQGTLTLEVSRSLDANDDQDRAITSGPQPILYAYGDAFQYHGKARGTRQIILFNSDGSLPPLVQEPLPNDVVANQFVQASNYTVPSDKVTTYACTSVIADVPAGGKRVLVAADPVLKTRSGKNLAHHLLIYTCADTPYFRRFMKTGSCLGDGPVGNSEANCTGLIYSWAVGVGRFVMPNDVGFVVNNDNKFLIMETHFDNSDNATDSVDQSGAKLYFADDRKTEAGVLTVGDGLVSYLGETVKNDFEYVSTCPSVCTSRFPTTLNVFGSLLHMHTTGKRIWTNRFSQDGKFIDAVNSVS